MAEISYSDRPTNLIYHQGLRDGACLLYAVANGYKALTGQMVTRDKWDRAIGSLSDPITFLTSTGATQLAYDEAVSMIDSMLNCFGDTGEHFRVDQLPSAGTIADFCAAVSPEAVVLFGYQGRSEFFEVTSHIVCGVATTPGPLTLHLACSAAFFMRHIEYGTYSERHHPSLNRYSNDSLAVTSDVQLAPNWRWVVSLA